jgi:hypothetical protein
MDDTMNMKKPRTWKQAERQRTRVAGRYSKLNPCELCGKSAGADYFSAADVDANGGVGLILCAKCADKWDADPAGCLAKALARA